MSYIPIDSQRQVLDPCIDKIVNCINNQKLIYLARAQEFTLRKLSLLMHPRCKKTILVNFELHKDRHEEDTENFYQELMRLVLDLTNQIEVLIKTEEEFSWMGMLNYCCTEILLLSTHERCYPTMSLLKEICRRVSRRIEDEFDIEDIISFRICGVFNDIADRFYKTVMAPYEDKQINKFAHGSTRGYIKWLPPVEDTDSEDWLNGYQKWPIA